MSVGHLRQVPGTQQYVYVVEEKQGGRTVRRTTPRMREDEARTHLRSQGLSDAQVEPAMVSAQRARTLPG